MAIVKFKDVKAGRTFYKVVLHIAVDGSKSVGAVELVRVLSRPFKEAAIPEVPEAVRFWQIKVMHENWTGCGFKPSKMYCFLYGLDCPQEPFIGEKDQCVLFCTSKSEAQRRAEEFLRSYEPDEDDIAAATNSLRYARLSSRDSDSIRESNEELYA